MNNVFFGTEGLTSTSANYYANMAQEMVQSLIKKLNNIVLYDTKLRLISSSETLSMSTGNTDISFIQNYLEKIGKMNSFCAWIREAIREKDNQLNSLNSLTVDDWRKQFNIELDCPTSPIDQLLITDEDIMAEWDVAKRNKYYTLEAMAAVYGKNIHPNGAVSIAREEFQDIVNNPIIKKGEGTNTILYYRDPSIAPEIVEKGFLRLQALYREYEKELNFMKASIKEEVCKRNLIINRNNTAAYNEYKAEYEIYQTKYAQIYSEFDTWKIKEHERISKLKIVIPADLKDTFSKIKAACKTSE